MERVEPETPEFEDGADIVTPRYEHPDVVALGTVADLTTSANIGPINDGNPASTFMWRAL